MPAVQNLVHETTTGTGTGNLTLANSNGKQSFNTAFGTGGTDLFYYFISNRSAAEWEVGTGHLSAATTLVRDTIIASSNAGAAVSFSAGTKDITNDIPAAVQTFVSSGNLAKRGGGFDIWQRGTTVTQAASLTAYVNDGWYLITNATQASTVSRVDGIADGSLYAAKVQRDSGQTGTGVMRYAMPLDLDELVRMRDEYVALSFTVKAGANWSPASGTLDIDIYFGTGAVAKRGAVAYTSESNPINTSVNLTGTATRVTITSSAAVAAAVTQAEIQFSWTPVGTAGADDSFTIDDLQLEVVSGASADANPYVREDLHAQYAKALRFFRAYGGGIDSELPAFGMAYNTTNGFVAIDFSNNPMRAGPTLTYSAVTDWSLLGASGANRIECTALSVGGATPRSCFIIGTVSSGLVAGNATALQADTTTDSRLYLSAEI